MILAGTGMVGTAAANQGGVPNPNGNGFGRPQVLSCGAQVTRSTKLAADIGPCVGTDGLDVVASGIRLDLNGHTITGSDTTNATNTEQVGVRVKNVQDVSVSGPGTITAFDAGVAVEGGGSNLVRDLSVHDNIAHVTFTGGVNPSNPEATACNYGDGIATDNSSNNTITRNTATHNGPYGGISLVDASTHNNVVDNTTTDQTVANSVPSGVPGPCGPFGANTVGEGRQYQDIGIRMEGPGAADNVVNHNFSARNDLDGISVFDNICPNNPYGVPPTAPNSGNLIENNTTTDNGFAPGANRDGIAVVQQGPGGVVCVPSYNSIVDNLSTANARDGVFLAGRGSTGNTINGNTVQNNGSDGIHLNGPSTGTGGIALPGAVSNTITSNVGTTNKHDDGYDGNANCDANNWSANQFAHVNQSCVDPDAAIVP
jgi:parallel beta-helix repeat protein